MNSLRDLLVDGHRLRRRSQSRDEKSHVLVPFTRRNPFWASTMPSATQRRIIFSSLQRSFARSLTLPESADTQKCDAELKDGVLTVTSHKS